MIDVKQGATFEGWTSYLGLPFMLIGLVLVVAAVIEAWWLTIPALLVFLFGLVIFMVRKGTLIDPVGQRFKPYRDFVLFRLGPWVPMRGLQHVRVKRTRESYTHDPARAGIMYNRTSFWVFNVTIHATEVIPELFVKEFYERDPALTLGHQIAQALDLPLIDETALPRPGRETRR
jgi:hypothetical protein